MGFRLEIGRRDGLKTGCPGVGFPSGMVQLRGDEAIVAVHGLGEPTKAGDAAVVMNKNLSAEVAVRPDAEGTDDNHRHPAHGAAFGIGDFRVADGTVFGHVHRHGRHDEPVFKAEGADGNGLEQWSVVHGGGSRKKGVSGFPTLPRGVRAGGLPGRTNPSRRFRGHHAVKRDLQRVCGGQSLMHGVQNLAGHNAVADGFVGQAHVLQFAGQHLFRPVADADRRGGRTAPAIPQRRRRPGCGSVRYWRFP